MKDLIFHLSIITICVCFSETYWIPPKDECPKTYAPCTPTITEVDCEFPIDAADIYGFLANGNFSAVANLLVRRTWYQIQKIQADYKTHAGNKSTIENQFPKGHLQNLVRGLLKSLVDFINKDLEEIYQSKHKKNVEEYLDTIGVLSKEAFKRGPINYVSGKYNKTKGYAAHFSVVLKNFLDVIGKGERPELTDRSVAKSNLSSDLNWLHASVTNKGVDPSILSQIINMNNDLSLRALYNLYEKEKNHSYLVDLTKNQLISDMDPLLLRAVIAMYKITENRLEYFADRLHESLTNNNYRILNRIFITRREIDLGDIKNTFEKRIGISLANMIMREMKDPKDKDYRIALLWLIQEKIY